MNIIPPRYSQNYEDRQIECEDALELTLYKILDQALQVGWKQGETIMAVENLIIHFKLAVAEQSGTTDDLIPRPDHYHLKY